MFLVATLLAVATVKKYGGEEGSEVTELKERSGSGQNQKNHCLRLCQTKSFITDLF